MTRAILTSLTAALLGCGVLVAPASAQSVWEMMPYRVQLIVAVAPSYDAQPRLETELAQSLLARIETVVGVVWDATSLSPTARLRQRINTGLDSLRIEDLPQQSLAFDKVFVVSVTPGPADCQLAARELDVRTQVFGPVLRRDVLQPAKLRDAALRAVLEAFTPLASIVQSELKSATLRLRGAALPARQDSLPAIRPGEVFVPLIRYNDRDGNLRKVLPIPWTFLVVEKPEGGTLRCKVHSGMTSPLSGRRRGRVEQLALIARPSGDTTRLVLAARGQPSELLAGYDIYVQPPDSKITTLLGRTDSAGSVVVPKADYPLRVLVVKNGKSQLARLPVVPGLEPELTAEIPSNDRRLEAEAYITSVQENLVDLITRRSLLMLQSEKLIDSGELDKAAGLVEELRGLPTQTDLMRELAQQQKRLDSNDPATKKKVDQFFDQTRRCVEQNLAPEPIQKLSRDLADARSGKRKPATPAAPAGESAAAGTPGRTGAADGSGPAGGPASPVAAPPQNGTASPSATGSAPSAATPPAAGSAGQSPAPPSPQSGG